MARLIDEYGLDGLGAELKHRWTTEGEMTGYEDTVDHLSESERGIIGNGTSRPSTRPIRISARPFNS